jgi:ubiquinone/menaquinone biosynthesis C-methylase UbiE
MIGYCNSCKHRGRSYKTVTSTNSIAPAKIVKAKEGYDSAARFYDSWHWTKFWSANESRYLTKWIAKTNLGNVLDAGCGTGHYHNLIRSYGNRYLGLDLSDNMLDVNTRKVVDYGEEGSIFIQGDIRECPVRTGSMDTVLCTRVLSHIPDTQDALEEFRRVLSSGGLAIISDIHPSHPYEHTSITVPNGKVAIETYKHGLDNMMDIVKSLGGIDIVEFRVYTIKDLYWRPKTRFRKIYKQPFTPIFYSLVLGKR